LFEVLVNFTLRPLYIRGKILQPPLDTKPRADLGILVTEEKTISFTSLVYGWIEAGEALYYVTGHLYIEGV
jgi:hypothetical protein